MKLALWSDGLHSWLCVLFVTGLLGWVAISNVTDNIRHMPITIVCEGGSECV